MRDVKRAQQSFDDRYGAKKPFKRSRTVVALLAVRIPNRAARVSKRKIEEQITGLKVESTVL